MFDGQKLSNCSFSCDWKKPSQEIRSLIPKIDSARLAKGIGTPKRYQFQPGLIPIKLDLSKITVYDLLSIRAIGIVGIFKFLVEG